MCSLPASRSAAARQVSRRAACDLGGHVRDLELDGLEVGDGVAELLALRARSFIDASRLAWAMPSEKAAMPMRPRSRMRSVSTKP